MRVTVAVRRLMPVRRAAHDVPRDTIMAGVLSGDPVIIPYGRVCAAGRATLRVSAIRPDRTKIDGSVPGGDRHPITRRSGALEREPFRRSVCRSRGGGVGDHEC